MPDWKFIPIDNGTGIPKKKTRFKRVIEKIQRAIHSAFSKTFSHCYACGRFTRHAKSLCGDCFKAVLPGERY